MNEENPCTYSEENGDLDEKDFLRAKKILEDKFFLKFNPMFHWGVIEPPTGSSAFKNISIS